MGLSVEGFWRGIWNWEDGFWKGRLKKRKRKRRKEIGEFSFLETKFRSWRVIHRKRMEEKKWGGFFAEKHSGSRKRAIATKVVRVCSSMFLKLITYAWFLLVFLFFWIFNVLLIGVDAKGHKFFSRYWLLMCSPQTRLWSSPLAWAHWKIMRCGFIWFLLLLCLFVLSSSSMVFHYTCFRSFLLVSWWLSVSVSYESKFWEDKDRKDPLFHPTEISSEMSL